MHHAGGLELVEEGVARIGWVAAGDLSELPDDREAFKQRLHHTYPEASGHRRKVECRAMAPREAFPPRCLYALGASLTVFQVTRHRAELLDVVGALDLEAPVGDLESNARRRPPI